MKLNLSSKWTVSVSASSPGVFRLKNGEPSPPIPTLRPRSYQKKKKEETYQTQEWLNLPICLCFLDRPLQALNARPHCVTNEIQISETKLTFRRFNCETCLTDAFKCFPETPEVCGPSLCVGDQIIHKAVNHPVLCSSRINHTKRHFGTLETSVCCSKCSFLLVFSRHFDMMVTLAEVQFRDLSTF